VSGGPWLTAEQLEHLLVELDEELGRTEVLADIYVVGGAAMALAYDGRRSTRDLDAIFRPAELVRDAAAQVAKRYPKLGLRPDWLNDHAAHWVPTEPDIGKRVIYSGRAISVMVASPEFVLAMKLRAARDVRDRADIVMLCRLLGVSDEQRLLDVVEAAYGMPSLDNNSMIMLTDIAQQLGAETNSTSPPTPGKTRIAPAIEVTHRHCDAPISGGGKCKRRVSGSGFCWQHQRD